ncbi:30S ribosomal protein S18 [Persicirhabdus sediminis]|uniref:Small ribosomal subunit protein bS18 n=1 Tax=Persicirhabdus sediminis TaxID=454144 RepID=A0A8J7MAM8_9BACT|nr:30S ribosomal protein S18 [Persicirhabdus sediminis]MBK1789627.1 30S ribosomal protein S18 [Persicirhabdus sediminis]
MSTPKTKQRRINYWKANRPMPHRRHDIPEAEVNYKNLPLLTQFTTETGKILPRRVTGISAKLHRKITREIKRARAVNLMA